MASKKKTGKPAAAGTDRARPLDPDEFLSLDNAAATERMPKEQAADVETRRIAIHVPGKQSDLAKSLRVRDGADGLELTLPRGAGLARPGRNSGRLSVEAVARGIRRGASAASLTGAFRPPWVDYTPHPKVAASPRTLLRRIDGRQVEPHYGVFGADNRQIYYPSGYPWCCVGKILVWDDFSKPSPAWSASGVLIGGRVILTAGHVAPWGSKNWAMQFVPAYYNGASTLGNGVSSWVSDYYGYNTGNRVSAWDMLVARLYTPLGNTYGYFGTKDYSSAWEGGNYWTLAGYPGAVAGGSRPSRQMWWPVLDDDSDGNAEEVEYEADATDGNSGGPVFGFWGGQPYAIATHSGGSKTSFLGITLEDTNVGAGGGALNSLVAWARSNWP